MGFRLFARRFLEDLPCWLLNLGQVPWALPRYLNPERSKGWGKTIGSTTKNELFSPEAMQPNALHIVGAQ